MLAGHDLEPQRLRPQDRTLTPRTARRNLVLQNMAEQGYIAQEEAEQYSQEQPPAPSQIKTPEEDSRAPYFTSWLRQQLVDKYGAGEAFGGGLHVISTLDLSLQEEAQQIAYDRTAGVGLSSAVVVLDNVTGGVRAMVGGYDYREQPFNLATQGQRQPGSAFKPFTLVTALEQGISPDTVYSSAAEGAPLPRRRGSRRHSCSRSTTTRTATWGAPRSPPRRPTPTTRCTRSWACRSAPRTSPRRPRRWASRRRSRPTRR